jgi:hypothetical protein
MNYRLLVSLKALMLVMVVAVVASLVSVTAQEPAGLIADTGDTWTRPLTPWGDPDLQGAWDISTTTPLQRPQELGERDSFTAEEASARDEEITTAPDKRGATPEEDFAPYNAFWWDRGSSLESLRASLIVDPPNGRLPALTPEGKARDEAWSGSGTDSWDDRSLYDRCIVRQGLPRLPAGYNNNFQIVQSPGYVAIVLEQIHETRVVPLDGREHLAPTVRQFLGDSRGRWEGDTLVVETTNLTEQTHLNYNSGFHSEDMHIVERFTRVAPDRINYEFTITDPRTWTSSWTAAFPWNATEGGELFEYACHEGNYSMTNMLSGARAEEHAAEDLTQKTQQR